MFVGRYACTCMKVTRKDIEDAVRDGASTFREVHLKTRCGGKCGACIDTIKKMVQDAADQKTKE